MTETTMPEELTFEDFVCKNDWSWVGFLKHDKFTITRNDKTGIIFATCTKCGTQYDISQMRK